MGQKELKLFNDCIVLYSQRMDYFSSHKEWRDNVDQRIIQFIEKFGGIPVGMPNNISNSELYIERIKPEYIILTGGNTVSSKLYESNGIKEETYIRDMTEYALLNYAITHKIPVFGICRGMQLINVYFGGRLDYLSGHTNTSHLINIVNTDLKYEVNSYHNQAITKDNISSNLNFVAISNDGNVEALKHKEFNIWGVQWHPEREVNLSNIDEKIMKEWIGGKPL